MSEYYTGINYKSEKGIHLNASYVLTKRFECNDYVDVVVEKLERLKTEDFNRVLIPEFEYTVNGKIVEYSVSFIKGYPTGCLSYPDIIYEDIIKRDSPWTFTDLHSVNFIVETKTKKIYAVDFQSYEFRPNPIERERLWEKAQEWDKYRMKKIVRYL